LGLLESHREWDKWELVGHHRLEVYRDNLSQDNPNLSKHPLGQLF
jgi:hypothetical protein